MVDVLVGPVLHVGDITVTPLLDGFGRVDPQQFFAAPDSGEIAHAFATDEHRRWLDHDGVLELPIASFLVRGHGRTGLIDLGVGTFNVAGFSGGRLPEALRVAGVDLGEIDTVMFSHLHFDHVGWATTKHEDGARSVTFPNATLRCGGSDWTHFVDDEQAHPAVLERILRPVASRVEPCADGDTVFPGVSVVAAPGHTPGHQAYVIADGSERAIILGDAVHCPVQLEYGEWQVMGDVDPQLAVRTREALLRELDGDTAVAGCHFPGLQFGRLVAGARGRTWVPFG